MTQPPLTRRQQQIFDFIKSHIEDKGWPPTIREIGHEAGIRSPNGVMNHIRALKKKGRIETESEMSRCIRLVGYRLKHVKVKD
jgi:repressor LexA